MTNIKTILPRLSWLDVLIEMTIISKMFYFRTLCSIYNVKNTFNKLYTDRKRCAWHYVMFIIDHIVLIYEIVF